MREPTASDWAQAAAANEERILAEAETSPLRFQVHKVDAKGDATRQVIESRDGNVARLIARNGAPLTAAEDAEERERLQHILDAPETFLRHERRDRATRSYAIELLHDMPGAMLWSFAGDLPQDAANGAGQVIVDFAPNPKFKPPTIVSEALTGIAGRVWIDRDSHCVTRVQGRVLHPVDFGWGGVFARINSGGTVAMEQTRATEHRWIYTHVEEHLSIREVLVRTVAENTVLSSSDVHALPSSVTLQQAIHTLLALQVPVH